MKELVVVRAEDLKDYAIEMHPSYSDKFIKLASSELGGRYFHNLSRFTQKEYSQKPDIKPHNSIYDRDSVLRSFGRFVAEEEYKTYLLPPEIILIELALMGGVANKMGAKDDATSSYFSDLTRAYRELLRTASQRSNLTTNIERLGGKSAVRNTKKRYKAIRNAFESPEAYMGFMNWNTPSSKSPFFEKTEDRRIFLNEIANLLNGEGNAQGLKELIGESPRYLHGTLSNMISGSEDRYLNIVNMLLGTMLNLEGLRIPQGLEIDRYLGEIWTAQESFFPIADEYLQEEARTIWPEFV
ncbi:MAG: hypothetical protein JW727_03450 [Candidatus Aenigmarchaeota archaeon]|nr:hypothetical protein [Candidatus Aenigmarchaeota archaeon]